MERAGSRNGLLQRQDSRMSAISRLSGMSIVSHRSLSGISHKTSLKDSTISSWEEGHKVQRLLKGRHDSPSRKVLEAADGSHEISREGSYQMYREGSHLMNRQGSRIGDHEGGLYELSESSSSASSSSYESTPEKYLNAGYARFAPCGMPMAMNEPPSYADAVQKSSREHDSDRKSIRKQNSMLRRQGSAEHISYNETSGGQVGAVVPGLIVNEHGVEGAYDDYGNFWTYDRDGNPVMPEWTRLITGDGVYYFYNWHTGNIRFSDPSEDRYPRESGVQTDHVVDRAVRKNPHWKSVKRAYSPPPDVEDEEIVANAWKPKYRGKNWAPRYKKFEDGHTEFSHWEDSKGRRLGNDLPRWFGPVFTHD